jgi:hypothetical protein
MQSTPSIKEEFMPRTNASSPFSRLMLLGLASSAAALLTLAAAELMPARSLGPIAGIQAISATPSRADLDYAHRAFEQFRDQPDRTEVTPTVALSAPSAGN